MPIPHRKPNRFAGWDYSTSAYYFVTICTHRRQLFFGQIQDEEMSLNTIGKIAYKFWQEIPSHFESIELDEFIIMPNHIHGIIFIKEPEKRILSQPSNNQPSLVGTADLLSLHPKPSRKSRTAVGNEDLRSLPRTDMLLSKIIHAYKSSVTRTLNKFNPNPHFKWQRSFYDHIIQKESQLNNIREYIKYNPHKWHRDLENPYYLKQLNKFEQNKLQKNYYKNIYS